MHFYSLNSKKMKIYNLWQKYKWTWLIFEKYDLLSIWNAKRILLQKMTIQITISKKLRHSIDIATCEMLLSCIHQSRLDSTNTVSGMQVTHRNMAHPSGLNHLNCTWYTCFLLNDTIVIIQIPLGSI